jgi:hypothetical protein
MVLMRYVHEMMEASMTATATMRAVLTSLLMINTHFEDLLSSNEDIPSGLAIPILLLWHAGPPERGQQPVIC